MGKLKASVNLNSGHHPEMNEQVEQVNQETGRFLKTFWTDNQGDWDWAEYTWNSFCHSATHLPPYQWMLAF